MRFCDYAKIFLQSGSGGRGAVSFRREKNIPFGGPDGGRGGDGGSVFFRGNKNHVTLFDFRFRPHYKAKSGQAGHGGNRSGLSGDDLYIDVPLGTEVWIDGQIVFDLIDHGQKECVLVGGKGGRGNTSFATSTNRTPREFTPGQEGQSATAELRLKILADVGLIGMPNAGKSTLLSTLTAAQSKIGDYPFTTLHPHLGTFLTPDHQDIVLADLPGLVEGANQGKGLGHRFLAHGERCKGLLHVIDGSQGNVRQAYDDIWQELLSYNSAFRDKKEIIVVTKKDLMTKEIEQQVRNDFEDNIFIISSLQSDSFDLLEKKLCQTFLS